MSLNRCSDCFGRLFALISLVGLTAARGQSLYFSLPAPPWSETWTSYSVPLNESAGWRIGSLDGPSPTAAEFTAALGNLRALEVSLDAAVEFYLDNVNLAGLALSTFPDGVNEDWTLPGWGMAVGQAQIGDPPGSISNGTATATFSAPAKFLGDQSAAYQGSLSFALWHREAALPGGTDVLLTLTPVPEPSAIGLGVVGLVWLFSRGGRRAKHSSTE